MNRCRHSHVATVKLSELWVRIKSERGDTIRELVQKPLQLKWHGIRAAGNLFDNVASAELRNRCRGIVD
jgi:hypothetical protein